MIDRLYDIIYINAFFSRNPNRIGLKNIACLIVTQFATFDTIRLKRQFDLRTVVNASLKVHVLLFLQAV